MTIVLYVEQIVLDVFFPWLLVSESTKKKAEPCLIEEYINFGITTICFVAFSYCRLLPAQRTCKDLQQV